MILRRVAPVLIVLCLAGLFLLRRDTGGVVSGEAPVPTDVLAENDPPTPAGLQPEPGPFTQESPAPAPDSAALDSDTMDIERWGQEMRAILEQEPEAARTERFLNTRGRTARNLLQAYRVSGDDAYLSEALHMAPNDPMAVLEWALYLEPGDQQRTEALLHLGDLMPDNAFPFYLLGEELLKRGNHQDALNLLMAGKKKPVCHYFQAEVLRDQKAYLEVAGLSPGNASIAALLELNIHMPAIDLFENLKRVHEEVLTLDQDPVAAEAWAIVGTRMAEHLRGQNDLFVVDRLLGIKLENDFLDLLEADDTLGVGGKTVAQRRADLEIMRRNLLGAAGDTVDALIGLTDQEKETALDLFVAKGELEVLTWLNEHASSDR